MQSHCRPRLNAARAHVGTKKRGGTDSNEKTVQRIFYTEVQLLLLCPPSHLLDHRSQTNPSEEAPPIKHRPNHLLNRQRPKYPSVRTVHSRRERRHDAELDEFERRYMSCAARVSKKNATTHTRTINCASTSNTSDTTRFRDAAVARRAGRSLPKTPNGAGDDRAHEHEARLVASRTLCSIL
jgi:hypothetical protein